MVKTVGFHRIGTLVDREQNPEACPGETLQSPPAPEKRSTAVGMSSDSIGLVLAAITGTEIPQVTLAAERVDAPADGPPVWIRFT